MTQSDWARNQFLMVPTASWSLMGSGRSVSEHVAWEGWLETAPVAGVAIDDAWTASTLRGWILPALRNGLWNGPIIGGGRLGAAVAMGIVALIWLLALAGVLRLWSKDVGPGPRVGAAFLTAALLVMQARAGTVTPRQKGWFLRVAPAFVVSPRHRASERGNVATP